MVEHRPFKPRVAGSNPARLTRPRPHSLTDRTPGFHPSNGGSTPPGGAAGLAQRESACLTSKRSLVRTHHPAPVVYLSKDKKLEKEIDLLIHLQNLDLEVDKGKERRKSLSSQIENIEFRLKEIEKDLMSKKEELKQTKKQRRSKEKRIDEIDSLLHKHEEEKYHIKSKSEFEALDREIDKLQEEKVKEEDTLLELMEKEDGLINLLPSLEKEMNEEKRRLIKKKEDIGVDIEDINQREEKFKKDREKLTNQISKLHFEQYEQLRKVKNGLAVVEAKDGVCGGCSMKISPSIMGQVRRGEIVYCENCNRIIYTLERKS